MQRPRRIRADVLDLDALAILMRALAIAVTRRENLSKRIIQHIRAQIKIQKARAGNLRVVEPIAREAFLEFFCNLSWRLVEYTRRLHREVRREVAEFLLRRHFELHICERARREYAIRDGRVRRVLDGFCQCLLDIQKNPPHRCHAVVISMRNSLLLWNFPSTKRSYTSSMRPVPSARHAEKSEIVRTARCSMPYGVR